MKRIPVTALLSLAALLTGGSALAQMRHEVRAYVPYDFTVGTMILPAGHYSFDSVSSPAAANDLRIENTDVRGFNALVRATDDGPWQVLPSAVVNRAHLVFDQYGGQYFLREVRGPVAAVNVDIPISAAEEHARRSQRNEAAGLSSPNQTTAALR